MPGRNIYKEYLADSYYHVYNCGVGKQTIFKETADYVVFLSLLKRYLDKSPSKNSVGVTYPSYRDDVELLAFCLMPSHFHLFLYQHNVDGMRHLLKSLGVAYSMYFNRKYKRLGPVFQQRYRASRISSDAYLIHISRYIHLNPNKYTEWKWSSLPYYIGKNKADWVKPKRILELFDSEDYLQFLHDYKDKRDDFEEIKSELANNPL